MLKHFVVLGDGIQGYWVARWLCRFLNLPQNSFSLTLILSKESPPPQGFTIEPSFLHLLGISQEKFLSQVNASFHLASKWIKGNKLFFHSSGDKELLANYPLLLRNWLSTPATQQEPFFKIFNPQLALLEKDKVMELSQSPLNYAYHFCEQSFVALLEKELLAKGCKIVKNKIKGKKHLDPFSLSYLYDETSTAYPVDLLINTCKLPSFLFETSVSKPPFWEWHYPIPRLATDEKLPLYSTHHLETKARIHSYELKNVKNLRVVFSSCQDTGHLKKILEAKGLQKAPKTKYKYPSFQRETSWMGNVIHLGEAMGQDSGTLKNYAGRFLERQLRLLDRFFPKKENMKTLASSFNEKSKALCCSYQDLGALLSPPFNLEGVLLDYQKEAAKGLGICFEEPEGLFSPFEMDGFLYSLKTPPVLSHPIFSRQDLQPYAKQILFHIKNKYQQEKFKLYTHYLYLNHFQPATSTL